uniref:Uncharacterized protein n=1 Tax=Anguilla anguilla TaxID=7936 RepID=A0A0E9QIW2_ANGAN
MTLIHKHICCLWDISSVSSRLGMASAFKIKMVINRL